MAAAARTHLGHLLIGLGSLIRDFGFTLAPTVIYSENGHHSDTTLRRGSGPGSAEAQRASRPPRAG